MFKSLNDVLLYIYISFFLLLSDDGVTSAASNSANAFLISVSSSCCLYNLASRIAAILSPL